MGKGACGNLAFSFFSAYNHTDTILLQKSKEYMATGTKMKILDDIELRKMSENEYEHYVIETTDLSVDETVLMIKEAISRKTNLLV